MPIRVMVVDDSSVVRKLLTMVLEPEPDIELAGTASNGREALALIPSIRPDLVTLDVEMPELDGLATMEAIHEAHPGLAVIMFSSITERGATATINALRAGALDYVTKPTAGSTDEAFALMRQELLPRIRVLAPRAMTRRRMRACAARRPAPPAPAPDSPLPGPPGSTVAPPADRPAPDGPPVPPRCPPVASATLTTSATPAPAAPAHPVVRRLPSGSRRPVELVVIGVSTGGPVALEHVLPRLPAGFAVPVVIVQHMPRLFTEIFAQRLDTKCALRVAEAAGGEVLEPGSVWVAPGGFHLVVTGGRGAGLSLAVDDGPPENSCKPAVDVLFRSAAAAAGDRVLAAVLTGMGSDGKLGAAAIVAAGGTVLAQDEESSVVWGMPGAVVEAGLAGAIVPLEDVAPMLVQRAGLASPAR